MQNSVSVVLRFVRALDVDVDVLRLLLGEPRERAAERLDMDLGDLLVEVLRESVDLVPGPCRLT